ncbi:hypothetical protein R5R35_010185 [Gryllus longicercus]|uniref:Uncharacterized protein n=1 Tax=Gryllus longicercus TaxID=2509291 RepID=A0AAN9VQZ6_9ORTH|nr:Uncharacterized protein GBIM_11676 [Gryllus bimaculatus]
MNPDSEFIVTKSALVKKRKADEFECVKFESYKSNKKIEEKKTGKKQPTRTREIDVNKVTHEVVKFGIAGMKPEERRKAKETLLIKLGAKPPKREYMNYKNLMQKNREEKARLEFLAKTQPDDPINNLLNRTKKKKQPTHTQKRKNNILEAYGKPGQNTVHKKHKK